MRFPARASGGSHAPTSGITQSQLPPMAPVGRSWRLSQAAVDVALNEQAGHPRLCSQTTPLHYVVVDDQAVRAPREHRAPSCSWGWTLLRYGLSSHWPCRGYVNFGPPSRRYTRIAETPSTGQIHSEIPQPMHLSWSTKMNVSSHTNCASTPAQQSDLSLTITANCVVAPTRDKRERSWSSHSSAGFPPRWRSRRDSIVPHQRSSAGCPCDWRQT